MTRRIQQTLLLLLGILIALIVFFAIGQDTGKLGIAGPEPSHLFDFSAI